MSVLGENVLVTGTDYGHNDLGSELGVHQAIEQRTDISVAARKIVDDNGRRLFGIDSSFRPAPDLNEQIESLPNVLGVQANGVRVLVRASIDAV